MQKSKIYDCKKICEFRKVYDCKKVCKFKKYKSKIVYECKKVHKFKSIRIHTESLQMFFDSMWECVLKVCECILRIC